MPGNPTRKHGNGAPIRYILVLWLLVLSAVAFLDRTNISIAGVQIGSEFKIDNARLGWVFSAFLIGYASFQIPGGVLARRFGPRRLLAFSVIWWGVFTALTAFVPPGMRGALLVLVLVRIALGAGEAIMYPAANQFVERWIPIAERGKANGIIFGGVGIGSGLTPPLLTAIILHFGWRASFWFCAVVGLLAGTVWYLAARDTPEEHPWVTSGELDTIVNGRGDAQGRSAAPNLRADGRPAAPWRKICCSKEVLALTASYFAYGYVAWIYFSWFYIYLAQVRGLNLKASALYSMFPFIAMTLGSLFGGVASDWLARHVSIRAGRCFLPALALGCTAILLLFGSRAQDPRVASAVLACGAGALYLSQSCFWSVSADFAGEFAGMVSGTMNMGCQIGGAVTASLTPLIASHLGWEASFLMAAILAVLGALAWLAVDPRARLAGTARS
ncbi:MAG TPA: MFS transporter [Terracidiphilus sp.]|jgi:ACS family glucarate transporter-like MFS transporter|nr:MFS transporter [Terracidiphilus sp.]